MNKASTDQETIAAYQALIENMGRITAQCQELVNAFSQQQPPSQPKATDIDPFNISNTFIELGKAMMANPERLVQAQMSLMNQYADLWQKMLHNSGKPEKPEGQSTSGGKKGDRRFKDAAWEENPLFEHLKQAYLLTAQHIEKTVAETSGLDEKEARKAAFYTRQFVDSMSPSNFLLTNPEALKETIDSKGENLVRGLRNVIEDLKAGEGQLKIRQTDTSAFEVGVNIATTPGKVVFRNELMELIQYAPLTKTVFRRPLLIIPPWINKFYILDLEPKNSFIRWSISKGYTVFVISWVNPDAKLAEKNFVDYMHEGIFAALDAIAMATGEREVNTVGYCIGGTLLASTLAYMAARGDKRIKAATMLVAQVDFSEPGELEVFIDEEQINALDEKMSEKGYLESSSMSTTFNLLRANDLIWSFVVNNYLLGKEPYPFNLLYWNQDSTRMPRAMHLFYLREMYLHNHLVKPGAIVFDDVPIDLTTIKVPMYLQSAREDHISPYPSVFKGGHHFQGPVRFIIAGSGHIAGVINPPAAHKYHYLVNEKQPDNLDEWLAGAEEHPGSWWPDWHRWLYRRSGKKIPARRPGDGQLKPLEDAPGSYVKMK